MKWKLGFLGAVIAAPLCAGCGSSINQPREGQGGVYTNYVMSLYEQPNAAYGRRTIEFPIRVAVAQVGEDAPAPSVVQRLEAARDVFRNVTMLPAPVEGQGVLNREPVQALQSLARDQGADYLLMYAATIDTQNYISPLSALDLTIVGAFVVPSQQISADARGSAVLIDLRTGRVALSTGARASASRYSPQVSVGTDAQRVSSEAHAKVFNELAGNLILAARQRLASQGAIESAAELSASSGPAGDNRGAP